MKINLRSSKYWKIKLKEVNEEKKREKCEKEKEKKRKGERKKKRKEAITVFMNSEGEELIPNSFQYIR